MANPRRQHIEKILKSAMHNAEQKNNNVDSEAMLIKARACVQLGEFDNAVPFINVFYRRDVFSVRSFFSDHGAYQAFVFSRRFFIRLDFGQ